MILEFGQSFEKVCANLWTQARTRQCFLRIYLTHITTSVSISMEGSVFYGIWIFFLFPSLQEGQLGCHKSPEIGQPSGIRIKALLTDFPFINTLH